MRVTVLFPDNSIGVDGDFRHFDSVVPADPNWRVIQWYDTYGNIEVYQGERVWLDNISVVQPYIDQWNSYVPPIPPQQQDLNKSGSAPNVTV